MKNLIILIIAGMMVPATAQVCRADYKDLADQVENSLEVWFGGHGSDHSNSKTTSMDGVLIPILPEEAARVPGNKAAEYYSLENSPSGGFLYKSAELPQRLHLEFDFYDVDDWDGDFRYSYLDYVLIRLMPRRFYHNFNNITLYDWTASGDTDIQDAGIDDYGIRIDIDQYKLRFKAPEFPVHLYSDGEYILKEGTKQQRFIGGSAYHSKAHRVSQSSEVDQEKLEYSLGANAHLGPIEFDASRKWREFKSKAPVSIYGYTPPFPGGPFNNVHNVVPELKATVDTFKIHTSHSGRIFVSATYSKLDKENEYSTAEATNEMGYGEIVWLPAGYISFTAKYRHQKNEAKIPDPALLNVLLPALTETGAPIDYTLATHLPHPGVESKMETASLGMRYSLIPRTNVRLQYTIKSKEVEDQSAIDWSKPLKTRKDIYEVNLTNWAIPKTRITAKLKHTYTDTDNLDILLGNSANNEPKTINQGILGLAITASPKVSLFLNGNVAKERSDELRQVGIDENLEGEALRQTYVASMAFTVSKKLAFSPSYTYISFEQERDIIVESGPGAGYHAIVHDYSNEQIAHSLAFVMMYEPTEQLGINASIGYTTTEGSYNMPTAPFTIDPLADFVNGDLTEMTMFSESDTEELNLRLDVDYDLGNSWGIGVDLRVVDWKDSSFDNPYDGTYVGGMLKLTKKIM